MDKFKELNEFMKYQDSIIVEAAEFYIRSRLDDNERQIANHLLNIREAINKKILEKNCIEDTDLMILSYITLTFFTLKEEIQTHDNEFIEKYIKRAYKAGCSIMGA